MIPPWPGPSFEWRHAGARPALVCRPLAEVASHLFTTRSWPLGAAGASADGRNWDEVASAVGVSPADLVRARQVHGAAVAIGRQSPGAWPEADVLLAHDASLALAVQVADCVPILMADARSGAVAAVHAGWRGLAARAPMAAVAALERECASSPADLVAAAGPSIGPCCYQVGVDVRDGFAAAGHPPAVLDRWFLRAPAAVPGNPPMPGLDGTPRKERWFFDAWAAAVAQLVDAGLDAGRVFSSELCTASHPTVFCSYRRDGGSAGRLAAAVRIAPHRPSPGWPGDPRACWPRA